MSILKKPLITEKTTKSGEKLGQYGFVVDYNANKIQIKKAVEKMYNVTVESVNTMVYRGKRKTTFHKNRYTSRKYRFIQESSGYSQKRRSQLISIATFKIRRVESWQ